MPHTQLAPTNDEMSALLEQLVAEQNEERPDDPTPATFKAASVNLDGYGPNELVVRLESPYHCGSGGCTLRVYQYKVGELVEVSRTTITRLPIGLVEPKSSDWFSLTVGVGGGGMPNGRALLRYDGTKYPSNPTVPPAEVIDRTGLTVLDIQSPDYPLVKS
ncbi:hypothetical protein [Pontixanthobacter sp. CEM42]|uniref:hypothetical protein n=1 Tax=Pontixanthobacter sp. CEM42 TaxID=2792077 RepID=UPI001AE0BBED|nr:hypothetical protein [Pontixanthobacter sp. CEM42]